MSRQIYLGGKTDGEFVGQLVPEDQAKISVFDHGLLYGDGVFEGIRVYGGKVFLETEHIDRLYESAQSIRLSIPISRKEMIQAVRDTVAKNIADRDGYVRLMVTRGVGIREETDNDGKQRNVKTLGLDPDPCKDNEQIIIIADSITLYPEDDYEQGLHLVTASTIRNHPAALNPRIKSLNYLNNILAKIEGKRAGSREAVMLNHVGEVAECTGDNIFIVKDGILRTPPPEAGILEGLTRNAVIRLGQEAGMDVRQVPLVRHDIYVADECFLTGTAAEVIAAVSLDGRTIGDGKPGPVTMDLRERFRKLTRL